VPHDADPAVAPDGVHGALHGLADSPVLVVLRLLADRGLAVAVHRDEGPHPVEEHIRGQQPADQDFDLRDRARRFAGAVDGLPRGVVLPRPGERARLRRDAVRQHHGLVEGEQVRDLGPVGLDLLERGPQRRVHRPGLLQLDQPERQTIDEQDDVGAAVPLRAMDGELVDRKEVVRARVRPVHQRSADSLHPARRVPVFDGDALREELVEAPVLRRRDLRLRAADRVHHIPHRLLRQVRVQGPHRIQQPALQDHLPVVGAFCGGLARRDRDPMNGHPPRLHEQRQDVLLQLGLTEPRHGTASHASSTVTRPDIRRGSSSSRASVS